MLVVSSVGSICIRFALRPWPSVVAQSRKVRLMWHLFVSMPSKRCKLVYRPGSKLALRCDQCWFSRMVAGKEISLALEPSSWIYMASSERLVCQGTVPAALLEKWKVLVGDPLICQIELYMMVLIRWQFKTLLCNRCSLWWVDNDAARFLYHKGLESQPYHERYGPGILRHGLSGPNLRLD